MRGAGPNNYVAVDFVNSFKNVPYYCGYLVWQDESDGLQLVREDLSVIDVEMVKALAPKKLETTITQFKCR